MAIWYFFGLMFTAGMAGREFCKRRPVFFCLFVAQALCFYAATAALLVRDLL
jgi:hypothetical protein